jgi:hypothetical protein
MRGLCPIGLCANGVPEHSHVGRKRRAEFAEIGMPQDCCMEHQATGVLVERTVGSVLPVADDRVA